MKKLNCSEAKNSAFKQSKLKESHLIKKTDRSKKKYDGQSKFVEQLVKQSSDSFNKKT